MMGLGTSVRIGAPPDDCVKFFICELGSKLDQNLSEFEAALSDNFAQTLMDIDTQSGAVEFDLASVIGRTAGAGQCEKVYARCKMDYPTIMKTIQDEVAQVNMSQYPENNGF